MQNYRKSTINTAQAHTQAQLRGTQHRFPRATGQQNFRANGSESSFEQRNPWASQVPRAPVPSIQTPFTGQGQFSASSTQQVVRVGSPQPPVNIWQQRQLQQQQAATATVTSRPLKQQHQAPGVQVLPNPGGPYGVPQAELGHANAAAAKNNINQITQSIPQQQQQALAAANARRTPPSHQNPTAPPQNYNMMYQVQQQPPNQRPQQPNQQYNMAAAQRQGMGQPPPSSQMGAGPRQQRPPQQMGQQQQPPNMTSTAGGIPYNTTMFMQGPQPPQFISGAPSVITITGQHPPQMHIDPYNMQQQYNQQLGGGQPRMPTFMPTGFNPAAGPPGGAPGQYGQLPPMFHPSYTASQPVAGAALQQPTPQPASQQPPQPTEPGKDTMPRQPTNTVYYGGGPNQGGQPGGPPGQPQVVTSMGTPTGHPGGMRPPMPQQPQQPINAAHYEKRPRKGLQIIDPNSGRDFLDEIYDNRQQKAPQVESTPPPSTAQTTDAPPAQAAPAVSQPSQEIQSSERDKAMELCTSCSRYTSSTHGLNDDTFFHGLTDVAAGMQHLLDNGIDRRCIEPGNMKYEEPESGRRVRSNFNISPPRPEGSSDMAKGRRHEQEYQHESARLATVVRWPETACVSPEELAQAGFVYLGSEDRVQPHHVDPQQPLSQCTGIFSFDETEDPNASAPSTVLEQPTTSTVKHGLDKVQDEIRIRTKVHDHDESILVENACIDEAPSNQHHDKEQAPKTPSNPLNYGQSKGRNTNEKNGLMR